MEDHEETMVVSTELRGHQAVIVLEGELDLHTGLLLTDAVERAITEGATSLDIDAARLTFADSSGLCALVACRRRPAAPGRTYGLPTRRRPLDRVLEMTGLRRVFVRLDA